MSQPTIDLTATNFRTYLRGVTHVWFRLLLLVGTLMFAFFFVLDLFVVSGAMLVRFGIYRGVTVGVFLLEFLFLSQSQPHRLSFLYAYVAGLTGTATIVIMTVELGGYASTYWVGLHLVNIGISLFIPWRAIHTALIGVLVLVVYNVGNLLWGGPHDTRQLLEPLFFMSSVAVLSVFNTHIRHQRMREEFFLRSRLMRSNWQLERSQSDLRSARDALWGEMEIAKRIQTSLLPTLERVNGFQVSATMLPAKEVGGDYYDLITTGEDELWVTIGDVSGHGVESGLIMMMTQTSVSTSVQRTADISPSRVLSGVNAVLKENIARLGASRYVTLSALRLRGHNIQVAGLHQDIIHYQAATGTTRRVATTGTWLGIVDDATPYLSDLDLEIADEDIVLLFTDGVTEAENAAGELYGQERLEQSLQRSSHLDLPRILATLVDDVTRYQASQADDITLVLVRRSAHHAD